MIVTVPGAVGFDRGDEYPDQRGWWTCCPGCGRSALLASHEVTFDHDDERGQVVTIAPSCVCKCGAHWWVERSEVRRV